MDIEEVSRVAKKVLGQVAEIYMEVAEVNEEV